MNPLLTIVQLTQSHYSSKQCKECDKPKDERSCLLTSVQFQDCSKLKSRHQETKYLGKE